MAGLGCVTRSNKPTPSRIEDISTLKLSYDNQGMVTLSISILTKKVAPITNPCFSCKINNKTFRGFIDSDVPRKLEGSDYYEHSITARGMVCK